MGGSKTCLHSAIHSAGPLVDAHCGLCSDVGIVTDVFSLCCVLSWVWKCDYSSTRTHISLVTFQTMVVEIKVILNDRPLTYVSSDINDAHLLMPPRPSQYNSLSTLLTSPKTPYLWYKPPHHSLLFQSCCWCFGIKEVV